MISRRLSALTLSLLALAGCHEDPTVESILVQPTTSALGLVSTGGDASSAFGIDGVGGQGGDFKVTTNGLISLGSPSFIPGVPAIPTPPSIFEIEPLSPLPVTTNAVGSIHLTGSLATAAIPTVTVATSNGDIVLDGSVLSTAVGTGQTNIVLQASNGTVYVSGAILTAGTDSLSNGQLGGNVTITAARVVITGSIDTHGVANTTVGGVNGGNGGNVDITSSQGPIFFTAGSIVTSGGAALDTLSTAGIQGGAGGFVHLTASGSGNSVYVFSPVTTDGGAITGDGTMPAGGAAGSVVIKGAGEIDILSGLSMVGGAATGNNMDALGGKGGSLSVDGPAVCKLYGSVLAGGGTAFAAVTGGGVTGGLGGSILLGQVSRLNSVELGSGEFNQGGGAGGLSTGTGGGQGGAVAIESFDGDITIESSISVAGGAASGAGNASGGASGGILIRTDASGSTLSNHVLSIASLSWLLNASGGAALGSGNGGPGGTVLLQSGGDLTCGARIAASGGTSVSGTGGSAALAAVLLKVFAASITATGNLNVTGTIDANGGLVSTGGTGGNASDVTIQILAGNGTLNSSATINSLGSAGGLGAGGNSGNLLLSEAGGGLNLSGVLTVSGSSSPLTPKASGNVTLQSAGALQSSASINAVGGASTDVTGATSGAKGGSILFDATGAVASLTLSGGTILADGGATTGSSVGTLGGAGGSVTLQTRGRAIDIFGTLLARGGGVSGTGTGGLGGQIVAVSDFAGTGVSGDITLESGAGIDVSGGGGSVLGAAQQNLGGDPGMALSFPISIAVIFDANGGTGGAAGTTLGRITNAGSITATGSTGGDIYYNGLNSVGAVLTPADATGLNFTGAIPGHFYPH